jgi:hypothetical protein
VAVSPGAKAVPVSPTFGDGRLRVLVPQAGGTGRVRGTDATSLEQQVRDSRLLELVSGAERVRGTTADWDIALLRGPFGQVFADSLDLPEAPETRYPDPDTDVYYVGDRSGQPIAGFYATAGDTGASPWVLAKLEQVARQRNLRALSNDVSPLAGKLELTLLRPRGVSVPGYRFSRADTVPATLGYQRLAIADTFAIMCTNRSSQDVYIALVDISSDGQVQLVYRSGDKLLAGKSSTSDPIVAIRPCGLETFKLIATTKPCDFGVLEEASVESRGPMAGPLSPLERILEQSTVTSRATVLPQYTLGDWATETLDVVIGR